MTADERTGRARPATLHDVAAAVGVSPRTVSRVVNDEGGFSESTRARVMSAVEQLHYRPNLHARGLISGRSRSIAFVTPVLSDPFFPELAEGVQRAARDAGLTLLFAMSNADPDLQAEVLRELEGHRLEAVVIFPARGGVGPLLPALDRGLRMVVVDIRIDHPNAVAVRSDLSDGARQAVLHLLGRGCRQLAMLTDPPAREIEQERRDAFLATIPAGMEPIVVESDINMEGGRRAMAELALRRPDVDGVFCFNDVMAIGALQALADLGRRVPDDVAVVGFDDIKMGSVVSPTLTTIRIDRERVGAVAVEMAQRLSGVGPAAEPTVLPVELVVRQSA